MKLSMTTKKLTSILQKLPKAQICANQQETNFENEESCKKIKLW